MNLDRRIENASPMTLDLGKGLIQVSGNISNRGNGLKYDKIEN